MKMKLENSKLENSKLSASSIAWDCFRTVEETGHAARKPSSSETHSSYACHRL